MEVIITKSSYNIKYEYIIYYNLQKVKKNKIKVAGEFYIRPPPLLTMMIARRTVACARAALPTRRSENSARITFGRNRAASGAFYLVVVIFNHFFKGVSAFRTSVFKQFHSSSPFVFPTDMYYSTCKKLYQDFSVDERNKMFFKPHDRRYVRKRDVFEQIRFV